MTATTTTQATTPATAWAIKRLNYYYSGTFYALADNYLRQGDGQGYGYGVGDAETRGKVIAVADKATAERIAEAVDASTGTYILSHGEYERPTFEARRIKADPARVAVVTEEAACQSLGLDYDLETI